MQEITRILSAIEDGDPTAAAELMPLVYTALRRVAAAKLDREAPGQTLQATALVHEAYLRITRGEPAARSFSGRGHFFAAAADAMRKIVIDRARRKARMKHGGKMQRLRIELDDLPAASDEERLLDIDEGLTHLECEFPDKAALVKLRYFAGLSNADAAGVLGISTATAQRYWTFARAWLRTHLDRAP